MDEGRQESFKEQHTNLANATIGIPLFEDRISPRCEYASRMLVLEVKGSKEVSRSYISLTEMNPLQKINFMIGQQIDAVICAGISGFWRRMLDANHIRVIQAPTFDVSRALKQATCRRHQDGQSGRRPHYGPGKGRKKRQVLRKGPKQRYNRLSLDGPDTGAE